MKAKRVLWPMLCHLAHEESPRQCVDLLVEVLNSTGGNMKTEVAALLAEMLLFGLVPIAFGLWQIREVNKERRKRQQERDQRGDTTE